MYFSKNFKFINFENNDFRKKKIAVPYTKILEKRRYKNVLSKVWSFIFATIFQTIWKYEFFFFFYVDRRRKERVPQCTLLQSDFYGLPARRWRNHYFSTRVDDKIYIIITVNLSFSRPTTSCVTILYKRAHAQRVYCYVITIIITAVRAYTTSRARIMYGTVIELESLVFIFYFFHSHKSYVFVMRKNVKVMLLAKRQVWQCSIAAFGHGFYGR